MVKKVSYWLYLFIGIHIVVWTLAPSLIRYSLPLDAMEGTTWGHQLEWGYDKNPFMNGWLTELAVTLGGHTGWPVYLFSQLSVALCFWAIWKLGKQILPSIYALIAVLLLEGIQYYNFHAIDFNDNTLEVGFWALTILFFYQATRKKDLTNWLFTGFFAGISMMTKYYTALLLLPMFIFLLIDKNARENFKKLPLYLGLCVFSAIITPHIIWLFSHDFITVRYAFERVSSPPKWWVHIYYPVLFTWQMFETFLPAGALFSILIFARFIKDPSNEPLWKKKTNNPELIDHEEKVLYLSTSDKTFLLLIGLGPFILTILLSAISGIKLRAGWGQPLMSLWGLILLTYLRPNLSPKQFYRFISSVGLILCVAIAGYCSALIRANKPSSANYPGKEIATTLTKEWHQKYNTSVSYIAGSRWLAGSIAFYSHDNPSVYIDWSKAVSTWIDEKKLKQTGAIFVWDLSEDNNVPYKEIKKRFPRVTTPKTLSFKWLRNKDMAPVKIRIAYLAPEMNNNF
jgi:4-amino-4-deoxy-L-arabinose transferase-like glycosyltransferase